MLALFAVVLIAGSWFAIQVLVRIFRRRSTREASVRRLHHASRIIFAGDESSDRPDGERLLRDTPDVCYYGAPHRVCSLSRCGYRGEPGRYQREAETDGIVLVDVVRDGIQRTKDRPGDEVMSRCTCKINEIAPALDVEFPSCFRT